MSEGMPLPPEAETQRRRTGRSASGKNSAPYGKLWTALLCGLLTLSGLLPADAGAGATGWAVGSQDCMGIMPALAPKPTIIRQYTTSSMGRCSAARAKSMAPPG